MADVPDSGVRPSVGLIGWGILQAESGSEIYLCGEIAASGEVVVRTSAVVHFDLAAMRVETRSGRQYALIGPPNVDYASSLAETSSLRGVRMHDVTIRECARRGLKRIMSAAGRAE